jgi:diaminopimelate decarboxylase
VLEVGVKEHLSVNGANHLTLHGVDLVNLCEKFGTPLFVFDEASLVENLERFKRAFEGIYPKVTVCYSVKTNNNLAICKIIRERGAYVEVSSGLDLHIALKAGFSGERIIFDGPFKPVEVLEEAVKNGVLLINCESFVEIERLNDVAERLGVKQPIGLRVNPFKRPSFIKSLHPKTLLEDAAFCFPACRFGFSLDEVHKVFEYLKNMKGLCLECLMMHPYHRAVDVLMPLFREAVENFGFEIKYLNIGGGFDPSTHGSTGDLLLALDYVKRRLGLKSSLDGRKPARNIEDVARAAVENVRRRLGGLPEPTLITEPGRYIVGPSGFLLLRVDYVKVSGGFKWVLVDGGTNIVPSFYERREVLVANNGFASERELVNVVGPLLYPKDFVAIKTWIPEVKEGDFIAVLDCGAYSLSSSTPFLYPRPAAVLVNSYGEAHLIRERETFDDVLAKDRLF